MKRVASARSMPENGTFRGLPQMTAIIGSLSSSRGGRQWEGELTRSCQGMLNQIDSDHNHMMALCKDANPIDCVQPNCLSVCVRVCVC